MPHDDPKSKDRRPANPREEGAVLIVVMMMLLSISATAVYTVSTATSELRGASAMRTSYQAEAMANALVDAALAWVDEVGPAVLQRHAAVNSAVWRTSASAATRGNAASLVDLAGVESVGLAQGQDATRLSSAELISPLGRTAGTAVAAIDPESLNRTTPSTPSGVVDVYDMYRFTGTTPGSRSDGGGVLSYLRATYTGRAVSDVTGTTGTLRDAHRTQATARAIATTGPYGGI